MKIKIVYGVDMRLWKHAPFDDKPSNQTYQDLVTYIVKTFEFKDINEFLIKFKDDDDELTTISSLQDFQDAYISYKEQDKKSLKLHIHDKASNNNNNTNSSINIEAEDEEKKSVAPDTPNQVPPIQSRYASAEKEGDNASKEPSPEEINAFLSDDFVIDLLSDLFIAVFEALEESQFEISFIECVQGIILSDDGKYDKLTSNKIWPYFCESLLPKYSSKIEMFVIPMIRNNTNFNSSMVKQWIPTMLNMMKMHQQRKMSADCNNFGGFGAGFGGFPWRGMYGHHGHGRGRGGWRGRGGRGGHNWRGRGWRHHHHGHNGHGHGWRGGRGGRRGWRGHHGHHHGHGHGHNAWFDHHQDNNNNGAASTEQELAPSAPIMEGVNDENEQMEPEQFEYTEELVAIMNMGFTNIAMIKKLLNEHKGNKQAVVQELVLTKN